MNPNTIYQIILSVLSDEASQKEKRILDNWLAESDKNVEEYEQIDPRLRVHQSFVLQFTTSYSIANI